MTRTRDRRTGRYARRATFDRPERFWLLNDVPAEDFGLSAPNAHGIRAIVGRQHVSASERSILRTVRRFLRKRNAPLFTDPRGRAMRRAIYQLALATHRDNRRLYVETMRPTYKRGR